ncbi:TATA-binding protein-associated factor 172 [Caerostris darwini]|uniref:TATA-binding protein-associated factor 172 n=1 Tax=Caerostris darwini TaxID=1538125 RepID=A0AAV4WT12_9ARAC|nr:TATA-binding protein-associated factor 172 [Caerostris darwini]
MTSRLDRLFLLLDTGSSPLTRKAAAIQLGEVQKLHPHELHNLLAKVRKYLYSSNWDTRIAAGQAVEAIIKNIPKWNVQCVKQEKQSSDLKNFSLTGRMKFLEFDVNKVIQNGSNLLACDGSKIDLYTQSILDPKEHLAKQREILNKHLGLNFSIMGLDSNYISKEDLEINLTPSPDEANIKQETKVDGTDRLTNETSHLSLNCIKTEDSKNSEPPTKKRKTSAASFDEISFENNTNMSLWEETKQWPLESFSDLLVHDLLNAGWEVRHGAATALREIIRIHGKDAGKRPDATPDQMEILNQLWLEDLALRLTCVLALDKFGDFISDQVVAPVRETCAQVLGTVANIMTVDRVKRILEILLQLLARPEWEARHGGLLGLKYILSVRTDMKELMIPLVFEATCLCLKDDVDDVSAVAASALVPVTNIIVSTLPDKVPSVISSLWDALLDLDDLTVSTSSILQLLASLLSYTATNSLNSCLTNLENLVPRLWPFLSHNSSVVRKSVLQAIITLTSASKSEDGISWLPNILQPMLRLLFQRSLVEPLIEIHHFLYDAWKNLIIYAPLVAVIACTIPLLSTWVSMLMQPANVPYDPNACNVWLDIPHRMTDKVLGRNRNSTFTKATQEAYYLGGNHAGTENSKEKEKSIVRAKLLAAKFLGFLCTFIMKPLSVAIFPPEQEPPLESFMKLILFHLNFKSSMQRFAVALILNEWAKYDENLCPLPVKEKCLECLNETIYFDEIASAFTRLQQDCKDFISVSKHYSVPLDLSFQTGIVYTFEQIIHLATIASTAFISVKLKPKILETLEDRRKSLLRSANQASSDQASLTVMVQSAIAGALVSLKYLPEKLNPIIRPLMDSIKREENELLQQASAHHLVNLMELCLTRANCPNSKILKNLTNFLCYEFITMNFDTQPNTQGENEKATISRSISLNDSIITLVNMQKSAEKVLLRRSNSVASKKNLSGVQLEEPFSDDETQKFFELQARGSTYVFTHAVEHFGEELSEKLPKLWESVFQPLKNFIDPSESGSKVFSIVNTTELLCSLQLLKVICSFINTKLHVELVNILPHLCCCLDHPLSLLRNKAASCLGRLSKVITVETMNCVLDKILGKLGASDNEIQRQGSIEAIACIIDELGLNIVPYIVFLIVPMLGRMSDQNEGVRLLATHCFASLIKLMPLEGGIQNPPKLHPKLLERKEQERLFLDQLMNPKKVEPYVVPVPINAELRSYQQEGVNWLAFLNKYKLNGILCDDMGLGKTLQSICILAGDHYLREQAYKEHKSPDSKPLPSLVICPPTLTGHWIYEVEKFISASYLNPIHYTGPPIERIRLRAKAKTHNLVIASYDIVRNDIDFFGKIHWNYCILDEGHIIKNGKTKLARAIKQLSANHRLILSGTPIQNNVLELWSLFDFLMPGFLGSEKQFTARYSKPILQSRDAKSSSKEQETGVLAMEALHRQVLPFLLRRMKEDVLKDLPPKIIQDYYCELSPLQIRLYEDFTKSRAKQAVDNALTEGETTNTSGTSHVFQALQYLRKVCNHPKLVLSPSHPEFEPVSKELKEQSSSLKDINHAAKLCALRQLLQDCGIGISNPTTESNEPTPAVNQHRALIFCQLKGMLDIVEEDLFKSLMPSVCYLRLDGSIPPGMRHSVVHKFNNDPSIDALLLTTQVGGLGLNLTGADTVIFVEHDWNPMKDLQSTFLLDEDNSQFSMNDGQRSTSMTSNTNNYYKSSKSINELVLRLCEKSFEEIDIICQHVDAKLKIPRSNPFLIQADIKKHVNRHDHITNMKFSRQGKLIFSTADPVCAAQILNLDKILETPISTAVTFENLTERFLIFDIPTNLPLLELAAEIMHTNDMEVIELRRFVKLNSTQEFSPVLITIWGTFLPYSIKIWFTNQKIRQFVDRV